LPEGPAPSGIRAIFDRANQLEAAGRSIVHLEIGRPDRDSPAVAKRAAAAALDAGAVHYTASRGLPELREAIADGLRKSIGTAYEPGTEIVVTAGGSEAVFAAVMAVAGRGDQAIVLEPAWPHYAAHLELAGVETLRVSCGASTGFLPDPDRVEAAIGPRTRLLILSSPTNPTGAVLPRESLEALAEIVERHGLMVISDEIYERFTYDGARHLSIAGLPGMRERTIVANSLSKTYSMTGWRVGYAAAPAEMSAAITAVHQYLSVCAPAFAQHGAVAALRHGEPFVEEMVGAYGERRRQLIDGLASVPALDLTPPAGAFYAFPRLTGGEDAAEVATRLLEEAGVAVVPGAVFGARFGAHLRLSYAVGPEVLADGVDRIRAFFGP
jgi:aminotransferase